MEGAERLERLILGQLKPPDFFRKIPLSATRTGVNDPVTGRMRGENYGTKILKNSRTRVHLDAAQTIQCFAIKGRAARAGGPGLGQLAGAKQATCCSSFAEQPQFGLEMSVLGFDFQKQDEIMSKEVDVKAFLAARKAEGLKIDPTTAEVTWTYGQSMDPYGIYDDLPEECSQVGRGYFARDPGSDIWVEFGDLPEETREALWETHRRALAFPAGLPLLERDNDPN